MRTILLWMILHKGIYINQYILDNEIQPIINPYTMTGAKFISKVFRWK